MAVAASLFRGRQRKADKATSSKSSDRGGADHYVDVDSLDESPSDSSGETGAEMLNVFAQLNYYRKASSSSTSRQGHGQHYLFALDKKSSSSSVGDSADASVESEKRLEKSSSSGSKHGVLESDAAASVGSSLHALGQCKPCRFITFSSGCRNKADCPFCHNEEHLTDPTTAERPPKGVRSGYRKSVNQVLESDMPDEQKRSALKQLAQRSPYLRVLVRRIMPEIEEGEAKGITKDPKQSEKKPTQKPREPGLQPSTLISL